jgi:RNase H-fold protein (predicted Holliday junction resolvase)
MKSEIETFAKNDVVIICGGTTDIGRNNSRIGLSHISQFINNSGHTNVIVMNPLKFDLVNSSCVNKEVRVFNRKLQKITKTADYDYIINMMTHRERFTRHGMHMNGSRKN